MQQKLLHCCGCGAPFVALNEGYILQLGQIGPVTEKVFVDGLVVFPELGAHGAAGYDQFLSKRRGPFRFEGTPALICVGKPPDLPMVPEAKENHRNPRIPVIFVRSWDEIKGGCAHIRGEAGP